MAPRISRSSKGWSPSAAAPACISAAPMNGPCTTRGRDPGQLHGRGGGRPCQPHRDGVGQGWLCHHPGQRPRHPRGASPEYQGQDRAGSGDDHAPCRRQIWREGLFDVGRPPWRGPVGCERPVRPARPSSSPATSNSSRQNTPAVCRSQTQECGPAHQSPGHLGPLSRRPARFSARKTVPRRRALYRMARSKAYFFRGVEIRWRCDPKLVAGEEDTPAEATLHFPGRPGRLPAVELADR